MKIIFFKVKVKVQLITLAKIRKNGKIL